MGPATSATAKSPWAARPPRALISPRGIASTGRRRWRRLPRTTARAARSIAGISADPSCLPPTPRIWLAMLHPQERASKQFGNAFLDYYEAPSAKPGPWVGNQVMPMFSRSSIYFTAQPPHIWNTSPRPRYFFVPRLFGRIHQVNPSVRKKAIALAMRASAVRAKLSSWCPICLWFSRSALRNADFTSPPTSTRMASPILIFKDRSPEWRWINGACSGISSFTHRERFIQKSLRRTKLPVATSLVRYNSTAHTSMFSNLKFQEYATTILVFYLQ